jgi:hypothetical protein
VLNDKGWSIVATGPKAVVLHSKCKRKSREPAMEFGRVRLVSDPGLGVVVSVVCPGCMETTAIPERDLPGW